MKVLPNEYEGGEDEPYFMEKGLRGRYVVQAKDKQDLWLSAFGSKKSAMTRIKPYDIMSPRNLKEAKALLSSRLDTPIEDCIFFSHVDGVCVNFDEGVVSIRLLDDVVVNEKLSTRD